MKFLMDNDTPMYFF